VTYQFTLLDFPVASGLQCHVFLVPINTLPAGNNPTSNEYVDYQCSNNFWLDIDGAGSNALGTAGYTVSLLWKTNTPNANAANEALTGYPNGYASTNMSNASPVGTWTLTFNNNTAGTLTPPQGVGALPFVISDPNASSDFADPVELLIGIQANSPPAPASSTANEGLYVDYGNIKITGTVNPINENFQSEPGTNTTITSSGNWDTSDSAAPTGVVLVTTNDACWVRWNKPNDIGYGLACAPFLPINQPPGFNYLLYGYNGSNSLVSPEQYGLDATGNYPDGSLTVPSQCADGGTNWSLISKQCIPSELFNGTTQSGNFYPLATNAYFELTSPPPSE